ncbi:unnamed protein product [Rotaria sp. Silwood2]|nr:unnamed protein product [Rotaria sp. Silwood2]CAF2571009.1 unnamed protein product [Rotaria sp. Silwood2]CAF2731232.1 unnamed protein product [Rotaria sp. Silwood2]CAF2964478.1 unnamed protein product [Rotaria sp. Silwood2]CAF4070948.1 unnamed protein product [Rotaria sp. Silwood2]
MALQSTINPQNVNNDNNNDDDNEHFHRHNDHDHHHEYDEEIDETEDDLIENYRFLTQHCGVLRQSPTTNVLNTIQQQQKQMHQSPFLRHYSFIDENYNNNNKNNKNNNNNNNNNEDERSFSSTKQWYSPLNDLNNNNHNYSTTISRIPPTIYYNDTEDAEFNDSHSFSLIKLFARMKARLKHDRRYRPKPTHELLSEEDPQEWYELTKNVRTIVTKALLPEGGHDALSHRTKKVHSRRGSCKKSRELHPVLSKDDDDEKINIQIDDELNTEDNEEFDEIMWNKFLTCSRGINYRRCGVCKTVDRQQFQGQLVYFYGVANNILIDENLKASGLG